MTRSVQKKKRISKKRPYRKRRTKKLKRKNRAKTQRLRRRRYMKGGQSVTDLIQFYEATPDELEVAHSLVKLTEQIKTNPESIKKLLTIVNTISGKLASLSQEDKLKIHNIINETRDTSLTNDLARIRIVLNAEPKKSQLFLNKILEKTGNLIDRFNNDLEGKKALINMLIQLINEILEENQFDPIDGKFLETIIKKLLSDKNSTLHLLRISYNALKSGKTTSFYIAVGRFFGPVNTFKLRKLILHLTNQIQKSK